MCNKTATVEVNDQAIGQHLLGCLACVCVNRGLSVLTSNMLVATLVGVVGMVAVVAVVIVEVIISDICGRYSDRCSRGRGR